MMPAGPLMIEHRLIERMIRLLGLEIQNISRTGKPNISFIDTAVDFIKTYADRCHHGKEEDILFRELKKKSMLQAHKETLNELIEEHVYARQTTGILVEAANNYLNNNEDAIRIVSNQLGKLVDFYPKHISKEDKNFFIPCMEYFTAKEKDDMLKEFGEFDRILIHEKYRKITESNESAFST